MNHWDERAKEHKSAPSASWADVQAMGIEAHAIGVHARRHVSNDYSYGDDKLQWLDVGCANGYLTRKIKEQLPLFFNLRECVDLSPGMVGLALDRGLPAFVEDMRALDQPDNSYDLITCVRALQNIDIPGQNQAIAEMKRVLKPGGQLIVVGESAAGRHRLNFLRGKAGMESLPLAPFNYPEPRCWAQREVAHMDYYFMMTRLIYPMTYTSLPSFDSHFSEKCATIQRELNQSEHDAKDALPMVGCQTMKIYTKETA